MIDNKTMFTVYLIPKSISKEERKEKDFPHVYQYEYFAEDALAKTKEQFSDIAEYTDFEVVPTVFM